MNFFKALDPNLGIFILRIVSGSFMLTHGYGKLTTLLAGGEIRFFDFMGIGMQASLALAVFAEFLCALLLVLGIKTRWVLLPLIGTMAVAAFIVHGADPFMKKELSLVYLTMYISLLITGGGKFTMVKD